MTNPEKNSASSEQSAKFDFSTNTMMEVLGMRVEQSDKDCVVMTMPVHAATRQPFGYLHGGASVALAESAASLATLLNIDVETQTAFGVEINANHLRSKQSGVVTATATPIHKGRTSMVWDIRIRDEDGRDICVSRCTMAVVTKRT